MGPVYGRLNGHKIDIRFSPSFRKEYKPRPKINFSSLTIFPSIPKQKVLEGSFEKTKLKSNGQIEILKNSKYARLYVGVPQRRKHRNVFLSNFTGDEGRPFEIGFQEQVSNHLKQLPLKAVVVSVEEKSDRSGRWRLRRRTQVNHWWGVVKRRWYQNGEPNVVPRQAYQEPDYGISGIRRWGGVNLTEAFVRKWGNQSPWC